MSDNTLHPRIIEVDEDMRSKPAEPELPRVRETEETGPIAAADPVGLPPVDDLAPSTRRRKPLSVAFIGLAIFIVGLLAVDAVDWVTAQFDRSTYLGFAAAAITSIGFFAACYWVLRELRSLAALRGVEHTQVALGRELDRQKLSEVRTCIDNTLAALPRSPAGTAAIAAYKRQVQPHHSAKQRVDLLSRVALVPADARAQAFIRGAALRTAGMSVTSLTALTDGFLFLALGLRLIRQIAECYGHRPGLAGTAHLVRHVFLGASFVGMTDVVFNAGAQLGSAALALHSGGEMIAEGIAKAGESAVAARRMARLGIASIRLCRPVVLAAGDEPTVMGLIGGLLKKQDD